MLEVKEYVKSFLNEIRGEFERNYDLLALLCEISELMECYRFFEFIYDEKNYKMQSKNSEGNTEKIHVKRKISQNISDFFSKEVNKDTILDLILKLLNEKRKEITNISGINVYDFSFSKNEHTNFVNNVIDDQLLGSGYTAADEVNTYYSSPNSSSRHGYSLLLHKIEDIELEGGENKKLNDYVILTLRKIGNYSKALGSWITIFNSIEDKIDDVIDDNENLNNDYNCVSCIFLNIDKIGKQGLSTSLTSDGGAVSGAHSFRPRLKALVGEMMLFGSHKSDDKLQSSIERIYNKNSYFKGERSTYSNYRDRLLNDVRLFSSKIQKTLGHELQHHKQWVEYLKKSIKTGKKPNKSHFEIGLPELPGVEKDYKNVRHDKGKTDPRHYIHNDIPHEYRSAEFYPRVTDCLHYLEEETSHYLKSYITIDISSKKFKLTGVNEADISSISDYKNHLFKIFIKEDHWIESLRKPHRHLNIHYPKVRKTKKLLKRIKRYYNKAVSELYKAFNKLIINYKSEMLDLLEKNERIIRRDIHLFAMKHRKGIFINYLYLEDVDKLTTDYVPKDLDSRRTFSIDGGNRQKQSRFASQLSKMRRDNIKFPENFNPFTNTNHTELALTKHNPNFWYKSKACETFWLDYIEKFQEKVKENRDNDTVLSDMANVLILICGDFDEWYGDSDTRGEFATIFNEEICDMPEFNDFI